MSYIWHDGKLVPKDEAMISVFDHGLLYGDGCFEGIRAYGGRILKLKTHLARMFESAALIHLKPAYDLEEIEDAIRATVDANGIQDGYIRLVFTRGVGTLGLHPFRCPTPGTFIIADRIQLYPEELYEEGMKVVVAKRPRIPIECLDPRIKSLNYLNNILAKVEAIEAGVLEAIMLNTDGQVAECTGDNIFAVKGDRIFTPSTSTGILHGVTRRFVMREIAPACGFQVEEDVFGIETLLEADEVFLTGTAAEVIGVSRIDDSVIGTGRMGEVTRRLVAEFRRRIAEGCPED
ncbi:MAG: branched-chain-amino-acid transaminase [Phycisphaeraceae bacterium]|nr:branched-chain-amino-acid transaminase [Phycisphaeraceae bacterium]MCP4012610.1 branched-chain-amino-acid transaminase [Phycisphaeraceae bacterium]MCP4069357.1 branched-chain-amino-acid transaminase [Phycisphaeraceae bacterium]MCP4495743.1 branched-chain-amino-acid transaminase [Phycisphaeraceae bacterium]MCP4795840.1 branched-chain-amino-acid transaminase [Phycisphaeraceae bacterium]